LHDWAVAARNCGASGSMARSAASCWSG
jgi:hypothetical protein